MNPFFERLKASLQARAPKSMDSAGLILKPASVLAPLYWRDDEPWALLTRRPEHLRAHPGQIAFPGGGRDEGDVTPLHTALREANEELGIAPESVEVLGLLGSMPTPTGFFITPFVGAVPLEVTRRLTPSPAEIAEVLEVPLLRVREEKRQAYQADRDAYVWDGSDAFIWGATHRMLRELLEHVHRAAAGGPK